MSGQDFWESYVSSIEARDGGPANGGGLSTALVRIREITGLGTWSLLIRRIGMLFGAECRLAKFFDIHGRVRSDEPGSPFVESKVPEPLGEHE